MCVLAKLSVQPLLKANSDAGVGGGLTKRRTRFDWKWDFSVWG
jgi:hypothetical protein